MQITNKCKIPEDIFQLIKDNAGEYSAGKYTDYSVTTLIDSPRRVQLTRRYYDRLSIDASELWASFVGNIIHNFLEKSLGQSGSVLTEHRLYADIRGKTISGQVDKFDIDLGILTDYKTGNSISLFNYAKPEWELQQNIYAHLLREHNYTVNQIIVQPFAYDWRPSAYKRSDIENPCLPIELPIWGYDEVEDFLHDAVKNHTEAEEMHDDDLPPCSAETMWERPTRYAVMQKGKKRALRVYDTVEEAEEDMNNRNVKGLFIEPRFGERVRCDRYCSVNKFCNHYHPSDTHRGN